MTSELKEYSYHDCERVINKIKEIFREIDLIKRDPRFFIYEHFSVVKNKVDLRKEILSTQGNIEYDLENRYLSVIQEVEKSESDCENNLSSIQLLNNSKDFALKLEKHALKQRYNNLIDSLKRLNPKSVFQELIDLQKVAFDTSDKICDTSKLGELYSSKKEIYLEALKVANKAQNYFEVLKDRIFIFKKYDFVSVDLDLDFGLFIKISKHDLYDSHILTNELRIELIDLCGFSQQLNWKLLYRASEEGFNGGVFHSKCNFIKPTITIIKTTDNFVFGGYTSKAWESNNQYVKDDNAFIFSLINPSNQPSKTKCIDPQYAIYCRGDRGPIFGYGQGIGGFDICIKNSSNVMRDGLDQKGSYSNLGASYKLPEYPEGSFGSQTFLAGKRRFVTTEIEVYHKIII